MKKVLFLLFVLILVSACTTTQPAPTSTPLPPTDTSIPPTQVPQPIEVTLDGNGCSVIGPTELPAGEHTFIFIDQSDIGGELWLLNNDDGKTFQDHLDLQNEPGEWFPKPYWSAYDTRVSRESEFLEGIRVDTSSWKLDRVGEHTIICYVDSPRLLWYVAPLMIIEAPSE